MSRIPRVPGMSNWQIDQKAQETLTLLAPHCLVEAQPVKIFKMMIFGTFDKLGIGYGVQDLELGIEAQFDAESNEIILSPKTYIDLELGVPRAAFTLGHELGHGVLHREYLQGILRGKRKAILLNRGDVPHYENPDTQANRFAGEFLMPSQLVHGLIESGKSIKEIASVFDVSYEAARVKYEIVTKKFGL